MPFVGRLETGLRKESQMGMRDPSAISGPDGSRRQEESDMFSRPGMQTEEKPSEQVRDTIREVEDQAQDVVDAVEEQWI